MSLLNPGTWRLVLVSTILLVLSAPLSARKSYRVERYDVDIRVERGGALLVTETVVFRFEGGAFDTIYRELDAERIDGVEVIEAGLDGRTLPRGDRPGAVEVSGRREPRITWHLSPFSDATRTTHLTYRVLGAVEQREDGDRLRWAALPEKHDYRIDAASVTVRYPQGARLVAQPGAQPSRATVAATSSSSRFTLNEVRKDRTMVVSLMFAPRSVIVSPPSWQLRRMEQGEDAPLFIALSIAIAVSGLLGLLVYYRSRRLPAPALQKGLESPAPPDDLPVAVAGAILQPGASPQFAQAVATLLDLARRGLVRIEEQPKRWTGRDFRVHVAERPAALHSHEQALVDELAAVEARRSVVKLSDLRRLATRFSRFSHPLKEEMARAGLIDPERARARRVLRNFGLLLIVLGGLLFIAGAFLIPTYGPWPMLVPAAVELVGLLAVILAAVYSPLSDSGLWRAGQWRAFAAYLKSVSSGKRPVPDAALFDRYLPYAATFGIAPGWVKQFRERGGLQAVPPWFHALAEADKDAMGALVAMVTVAGASGGHGGAGAGAGAAGGGASGAH